MAMPWESSFWSADDSGGGFNQQTTATINDANAEGVGWEFYKGLDPSLSPEARAQAIASERSRLEQIQYQSSDPYAFGGSQAASDAARQTLMQYGQEDRSALLGLESDFNTVARQASRIYDRGELINSYGKDIAKGTGLGAMSGAETEAINYQQGLMGRQSALADAPQGPSVAELQQSAAYDQLAAQNMSLAASQRGGATGAGTMMALGANSSQGQQLAQQQAILRAQEQEAFRQFQLQALSASGSTASTLANSETARRQAQQQQALSYFQGGANTQLGASQQALNNTLGKQGMLSAASQARAGYTAAATGIGSQELSGRSGASESSASRNLQEGMFNTEQQSAKTAANYALAGSALQYAGQLAKNPPKEKT